MDPFPSNASWSSQSQPLDHGWKGEKQWRPPVMSKDHGENTQTPTSHNQSTWIIGKQRLSFPSIIMSSFGQRKGWPTKTPRSKLLNATSPEFWRVISHSTIFYTYCSWIDWPYRIFQAPSLRTREPGILDWNLHNSGIILANFCGKRLGCVSQWYGFG